MIWSLWGNIASTVDSHLHVARIGDNTLNRGRPHPRYANGRPMIALPTSPWRQMPTGLVGRDNGVNDVIHGVRVCHHAEPVAVIGTDPDNGWRMSSKGGPEHAFIGNDSFRNYSARRRS